MYHCEFPNCSFTSRDRSKFAYHHIIPRSKDGSNDSNNRIWLCLAHHTDIYIPGEIRGIHSKVRDNSIIIIGWHYSTGGRVLEYSNTLLTQPKYYFVEDT